MTFRSVRTRCDAESFSRRSWLVLATIASGLVVGTTLAQQPVQPPATPPSALKPSAPKTLPGTTIENWQEVGTRLFSGSQPTTDEDFAELARRGVKTIVSVDGIAPDLKRAKQHGMRYVHIPIGYDALPQEAGDMMTNALRSTEGPIYVHCHHGKHRGPAMAAIAGRACGELTKEQAVEYLKRAGLSPKYDGLWRDVDAYAIPKEDAKLPPFVEQAPVAAMAKRMAELSRRFEALEKLLKKEGPLTEDEWTQADSDSLLAMEQLVEAQRELPDSDESFKNDATFLAEFARSVEASKLLHEAMRGKDRDRSQVAFGLLQKTCVDCHAAFRD